MSQKFFIYEHQDKGVPFEEALLGDGWTKVDEVHRANLVVADLEQWGREGFLRQVHEVNGTRTVLYPHSPVASCSWNFPGAKHFKFIDSVFLPASGHRAIMRAYKCKYHMIETGWPFSPVSEFVRTSGRRIIFAPIHPNSNGFLSNVDRELNRRTLLKLIELKRKGLHDITVRYVGELSQNGLWVDNGLHYVRGAKSISESISFINDFDLIVGHHTFAYIAVAMGKPTIMFGEFVAPKIGHSEATMRHVQNWSAYKHIMMYPLDILVEEDTHFLVERAIYSDYEIADWKGKMIGGSFNKNVFLNRVKEIINGETQKEPEPGASLNSSVEWERQRAQGAQEEGTREGEQTPEYERVGPLQEGV